MRRAKWRSQNHQAEQNAKRSDPTMRGTSLPSRKKSQHR
jgi:hypothetical protein